MGRVLSTSAHRSGLPEGQAGSCSFAMLQTGEISKTRNCCRLSSDSLGRSTIGVWGGGIMGKAFFELRQVAENRAVLQVIAIVGLDSVFVGLKAGSGVAILAGRLSAS